MWYCYEIYHQWKVQLVNQKLKDRESGLLTTTEHWLKALYKGSDDEIKADYTMLETNIQRLESATMFATLATVLETKADVKSLMVISMQSLKVNTQSLDVSTQALRVNVESNIMLRNASGVQGETLGVVKTLQRLLIKEDNKKESEKEGAKKQDQGFGSQEERRFEHGQKYFRYTG